MKSRKVSRLMGALQKFGPAIILVIAVIPIGGMLLGLGTMMQNQSFIEVLPFLESRVVLSIASLLTSIGNLILGNLHIMFAIAVAEGLSDHDGVAGFSGALGFLVFNTVIGNVMGITAETVAENSNMYTTILGIPTLQTGVLGGVAVGLLTAFIYKKFKNVKLPEALAFFQGKRFVPIVMTIAATILAIPFIIFWPMIQEGILALGVMTTSSVNPVALWLYGVLNRLLIPFGLHHLIYPITYFQLGTYTTLAGEVVHGDVNIFLAQMADGVDITAGTFCGGCYLFPAFCVAAALAITKVAKPENRNKTLGLFSAGILTIILTGITEPIEFVFLFTCFPLYIIHSLFMALSFPILNALGIHVGSTFCGGLMDLLIYGVFQNAPRWWLIIPLNGIVGVIYYFIFKYIIIKFDFKTPGREDEEIMQSNFVQSADELAVRILETLGGKENITSLDACATRLRVELKSLKGIDKNSFVAMGASGVIEVGNGLHIVFGTQAASIKEQVKAVMEGKAVVKPDGKKKIRKAANNTNEEIISPMSGRIMKLSDTPDETFASGMLGIGFAIEPDAPEVVSPIDGQITSVFPTKHAICIESDKGEKIMLHLGIDTVKLEGKPFDVQVKEGDKIKAGELLAQIDLEEIKKASSIISPIVFIDKSDYEIILNKSGNVKAGDKGIVSFRKK